MCVRRTAILTLRLESFELLVVLRQISGDTEAVRLLMLNHVLGIEQRGNAKMFLGDIECLHQEEKETTTLLHRRQPPLSAF